MKILGITGGIGAGKSTVANYFARLGADVIDADAIARQVTGKGAEAYEEIRESFGNDILSVDGSIDRKRLANIVFNDAEKLEILNCITHKHVFEKMQKLISESAAELICLDVPLLFTCDIPIKCDKTLAVIADTETRITRVMRRSGMQRDEIERRINNQLSNEEFKNSADYCIENNGRSEDFEPAAREIYFCMTGQ